MTAREEALRILRRSSVFSSVPAHALAELAAYARQERYPVRTLLCASAERLDVLRYVVDGSIEISTVSVDGRLRALAPMRAGSWAVWLGCFQEARLEHDLWAAKGTRTIAFPSKRILSLASAHPDVYRRVINEIGTRMRALIAWSLSFDQADAVRALGRFILASCRASVGAQNGPHILPMTHEMLADAGFGSRQRAGRLLAALEACGLVIARYRRIEVPALSALQAYCDERSDASIAKAARRAPA